MSLDFETYSEAGFLWDPDTNQWRSIANSPPHGLRAVGAGVYAEHASTEVLCMAYNLGTGPRLWLPGMGDPVDLFDYIARGGSLSAWNCAFEWWIWRAVCVARLGWPALPLCQLSDNMPRARAHSLPGALGRCAAAMGTPEQKDAEGKRLIKKFCLPRTPTKHDPRRRVLPADDPIDAQRLYDYCLQDIATEADIGARLAPLCPQEHRVWRMDQQINARGVCVDRAAVLDGCAIVNQAERRYCAELQDITRGAVNSVSCVEALSKWVSGRGVTLSSLDEPHVSAALSQGIDDPGARRALEIRQLLSGSSAKKVHAIARRLTRDGRLHDLFTYCGADRTGRWSGRGPQPQNLPGTAGDVETTLAALSSRSLDTVERACGCALTAISGALRGLFIAAPGCELICSDYSAIEAVVLAALAGEQWRLDVFRTHGHIYEQSGALITGVSVQDQLDYATRTGEHHPARRIGKVAELASGYQGSVNAWRQFGATGSDEEILKQVRVWRRTNPAIVNFWYAIERTAVAAIQSPGCVLTHRGIRFAHTGGALSVRLPSGRCLQYQQARAVPDVTPWGKPTHRILYHGYRPVGGWQERDTYGGKLVENITQGTARDILAHALLQLEAARYPVVLHVHDEPVSEIPCGAGSVSDYERILCEGPDWCRDWPIRASGGWRGQRYRKV